MPAPLLEIRDESDVVVTSFFDFGQVIPGAPTASITRSVHNGFGLTGGSAVDTAFNIVLTFEGRLTSVGGQWLSTIGLLESLALQIMLPNIPELAGWTNVGTGVPISLPDLPTDSKHEMLVRFTLPAGAQEVGIQAKIGIDFQRTQALPGGIYAHEPGISRGAGRGVGTAVFSRDSAFTVSGTGAGSTLRWPTYAWYTEGRSYQELGGNAASGDEVLSNTDKSASALIAGEAYGFLTVLESTGRTIVKANKVTGTPVFPTDFEVAPTGSILTGWGIRFADADALAPQHTELVDATPQFFDVTTSGLNYTVAPVGVSAIVHGRLNTNKTENTGSFPGDGTHTVWVLPDGSVDDTVGPDGATPQAGSERLVDIVIAASVETGRTDYRKWKDRAESIVFRFDGSPTGTTTATWRNPYSYRLWIRPESAQLQLDAIPGAGNVKADLFTEADLAARVTIFTAQGSDDRRPVVDTADAVAINAGEPEVLVISPGEFLSCDLIVTTATPAYAVVSLVADHE